MSKEKSLAAKMRLREALTYICLGVRAREAGSLPGPDTEYNYLLAGMNKFMAVAVFVAGRIELADLNETTFIEDYVTQPVAKWFDDWDLTGVLGFLPEELYYELDSIAEVEGGHLRLTSDGWECLHYTDDAQPSTQSRLRNLREILIYKNFREKLDTSAHADEAYKYIRRFVCEHLTASRRDFLKARAYLTSIDDGVDDDFVDSFYDLLCYMYDRGEGGYRLKETIEKYWYEPGRLEMAIASLCDELGLTYELWPLLDRYDVRITMPDGAVWQIDAKDYKKPQHLITAILTDEDFPCGVPGADYERAYYVVPDIANVAAYTFFVNGELARRGEMLECIAYRRFKSELLRRIGGDKK